MLHVYFIWQAWSPKMFKINSSSKRVVSFGQVQLNASESGVQTFRVDIPSEVTTSFRAHYILKYLNTLSCVSFSVSQLRKYGDRIVHS